MNPQKELQQMQDLSLKLDIPIWKNSIELPFRDKKKYHICKNREKIFSTSISSMCQKTKMGLKTIKKLLFLYPFFKQIFTTFCTNSFLFICKCMNYLKRAL